MNIWISIAMAVIILFVCGGTAMGVALAAKRNHSGAEASDATVNNGNGDLSCPGDLDAIETGECLDNYLKKKKPDSPLIGYGKNLVEAGQSTNINPAFLLAIAGQESTFGTVNAGNPNKENYFNVKCSSKMQGECVGGYQHFPSLEVAIQEHANLLNRVYFSKGLNTIATIASVYCPISDSSLCVEWPDSVTKLFNEIIKSCPKLASTGIQGGTSSVCSAKIVEIAQKEVGYKEGANNSNKYGDLGNGKYVNGTAGWCAVFASWVYKQAGYLNVLDAGPLSLVEEHPRYLATFKPNGDISKVKVGDIFWMKSDSSQSGTHAGIIKSINGNQINTIEGNSSDSVAERQRNISQIQEVARPIQCQ